MKPDRSPVSRPLRAFVVVGGSWVALRAAMLWHAAAGVPLPVGLGIDAEPVAIRADGRVFAVAAKPSRPMILAQVEKRGADHATLRFKRELGATPANATISGISGQVPPSASISDTEPQRSVPFLPWLSTPPAGGRFSGSAWALFRPDSAGASLNSGGTLGGSQAGIRLFYQPGPKALVLTARISAPLAVREGREASVGVGWRGHGVGILLERRIALDTGARNALSVTAYGGVSDVALPYGLRMNGYAQIGMVGVHSRDGFADGGLNVVHLMAQFGHASVSAGVAASGGIQPGVSRGDIGPEIVGVVPVNGRRVRIGAGWRERVVGTAAPGSGPSLSIGFGF